MSIKTQSHIISDDTLKRVIRNAVMYGAHNCWDVYDGGRDVKKRLMTNALRNARNTISKAERKDFI